MSQKHIIVIGAGPIGLSSALLLLNSGHSVTIIARDFPAPFETIDPISQINYTAPWAGAHNRFIPPSPSVPHTQLEHSLSLITYNHMKSLYESPHRKEAGITFLPGIEYLEAPSAEYLSLSKPNNPILNQLYQLCGYKILSPEYFPDTKIKWGCKYESYCLNPMVYLSFLLRRFFYLGGKLLKRELRCPEEVFSLNLGTDIVVNASGTNFGLDPAVFITRGQTVLVKESCPVTITRQNKDGTYSFSVPRGYQGGTIIGGTREVNNWSMEADLEVRKKLLKGFVEMYPDILGENGKKELTVLRDIVGRRPTRNGGPRIEGEKIEGKGFIMHAYGFGGRGFELSWGVAEMVRDGVEGWLRGKEKGKL
ncbi:putative D-amino-acid oxidase [Podospora fimiseda]|uniref:D-amino-acid oxidase n=1 Tax=Podospora fimiseda TaxID=252190 RepID=A0AAN7BTI7_9PEZI|nr:putative D-amino-acid oxidase [Podospora fimiseda]